MSEESENLAIIRRGFEVFIETGDFSEEVTAPDFVWDMSTFEGWPEQQTYEGIDGARQFMREWLEAWDDWKIEVEAMHARGDKVVAVVRQRGTSKTTGMEVDMTFAQVFTTKNGKQTRMQMYADPGDGLEAAGLPRDLAGS